MAILDPDFLKDLRYWTRRDPRVARRALDLIEHTLRDPCDGVGRPKPLRSLGPNVWSRRITLEHRLVYTVHDDSVVFTQARFHYGK